MNITPDDISPGQYIMITGIITDVGNVITPGQLPHFVLAVDLPFISVVTLGGDGSTHHLDVRLYRFKKLSEEYIYASYGSNVVSTLGKLKTKINSKTNKTNDGPSDDREMHIMGKQ